MERPSGSRALPETMKALELRSYDRGPDSLVLVERPLPRPGRGQVLVRIAAAPIHYHDILVLRGLYGLKRKLPVIPGSEGSGVVVASGGDMVSTLLRGRRVVCGPDPGEDGTWAEYILTTTDFCIPLRKAVGFEQGATMMINPLTAWVLLAMVRDEGHRAIVQTAAAGALGRMMMRLGRTLGITIIHIVRRDEQVELLRSLGAEHVVNSSEPGFDQTLKELCHRHGATLAFDGIGGDMPQCLLQAMPLRGRVVVYACLSDKDCNLNWRSVLFENKGIQGFWLPNWLRTKRVMARLLAATRAQKFFADDPKSHVRGRYALDQAAPAIEAASIHMTEGKILFVPHPR
jgi:NADPH2:quinone reductase